MEHAIEVRDLVVHYRSKSGQKVEAVKGLSMVIKPGEIVGFLGPNGAGKSSTLKAMMGFVEPVSGECLLLGQSSRSPEARRKIGHLPEVALYYPYLTPLETLTLYGELQGLSGRKLKAEAMGLLCMVGLESAYRKQNRQLSKGMLQRVGIAQSLLGNPDVLVLDEVTSGLDPVGRKELRHILQDKQRNGSTLLFSSHELAEVEMLCDRILLINQGRLIEERQMDSLLNELRKFSITFTGNASMVGLTDEVCEIGDGLVQAEFKSKELLLQAVERVQKGNGSIKDIAAQDGSLENYFIETIASAA